MPSRKKRLKSVTPTSTLRNQKSPWKYKQKKGHNKGRAEISDNRERKIIEKIKPKTGSSRSSKTICTPLSRPIRRKRNDQCREWEVTTDSTDVNITKRMLCTTYGTKFDNLDEWAQISWKIQNSLHKKKWKTSIVLFMKEIEFIV